MSLISNSNVISTIRQLTTDVSNGSVLPIQKTTNDERLSIYNSNIDVFYGPRNPYSEGPRLYPNDIKSEEPYIKLSLLDDDATLNFTANDRQDSSKNSVERDITRIEKFLEGTRGINFLQQQIEFQKLNPYNETQEFNEDSIVSNTGKNFTTRHLSDQPDVAGSNNISTLSSANLAASRLDTGHIAGTATADLSRYVTLTGGGKYGLLRNKTGYLAFSAFKNLWTGGSSGLSEWNENIGTEWEYRPEYQDGEAAYDIMRTDEGKLLTVKGTAQLRQNSAGSSGTFYKDQKDATSELTAESLQYNTPDNEYTNETDMEAMSNGGGGLLGIYSRMLSALGNNDEAYPSDRKSVERYSETANGIVNENNNYAVIDSMAGQNQGPYIKYLKDFGGIVNDIQIDNRGFARGRSKENPDGSPDKYNMMLPTKNYAEMFLNQDKNTNQSADLIFFYFYDLIHEVYVPFRATLSGLQDQNTPNWEEIKYMGRADNLYIYKGYSRNLSFNFRVFANSVEEVIPMWKRINYLVGMTRPSKYTARATVTDAATLELNQEFGEDFIPTTVGSESGFIYPPMIKFRIGDLYVDHPGVLSSVNISIPDEASWETVRDDQYKYIYGASDDKVITKDVKSRQLPMIVDVTVQLNMIERKQAVTNENHFGPLESTDDGWEMKLSEETQTQQQIDEPL